VVSVSWGAAHRLPFLPRVRYRRTILSPARWLLAAADLPDPNATWQTWTDHMDAWRRRFRVPAAVYLGADDRRIRLDLDEPAHQYLLRADLKTTGHATLREAPDSSAFGWLSGRAHEIVIPLAANDKPVPQRAWPTRTIDRQHGHLPAVSDWLYVKIYCHPARHIAILTKHLPTLMSTWDRPLEWWFLPYHDPEPHLRLRIRLRNGEQFGQAAVRIGAWASDLRQRGLIRHVQWDNYFPETGRFGDHTAMAAAESVFAADSGAAIVQLAGTVLRGGPHLHALIAASMVDLAISFAGSIDDGMHWLVEHARTPAMPAPARHVHDQAIRLADPHDDWGAVRELPGGQHIANAWQRRRAALATYRSSLTDTGDSVPAILPDLLHLHHVRMAGVSLDTERLCTRLARAAALSWTARTRGES
jgi:thiopeptide-type bacteriocin biosynthesis protein